MSVSIESLKEILIYLHDLKQNCEEIRELVKHQERQGWISNIVSGYLQGLFQCKGDKPRADSHYMICRVCGSEIDI